MLQIKTVSVPNFSAPTFTGQQTRAIGNYAILLERQRVARSANIADSRAKVLAVAYQRQKAKLGQPPVRNLVLTGQMLGARGVLGTDFNAVEIGFADSRMYGRAFINEKREPMLGLSPNDFIQMNRFIEGQFVQSQQVALRRVA